MIEGVVTKIIWKDQNRMCDIGEKLLKQTFGHPTCKTKYQQYSWAVNKIDYTLHTKLAVHFLITIENVFAY